MIEEVIIVLVVVFCTLPAIGNMLRGSFATTDYKKDLTIGLAVAGCFFASAMILFLLVGSIMHIAEDGPTILELITRIFKT